MLLYTKSNPIPDQVIIYSELSKFVCVCIYVYGQLCRYALLFEFYVLAISKVISGPVPTCDSAHSWLLYSAFHLDTYKHECSHITTYLYRYRLAIVRTRGYFIVLSI